MSHHWNNCYIKLKYHVGYTDTNRNSNWNSHKTVSKPKKVSSIPQGAECLHKLLNMKDSSAALLETEGTQSLMRVLERSQEQAHKKEDNKGNYEANILCSVIIFN